MHCRSCEILIGKSLGKLEGVEDVQVNFRTGQAEILATQYIDPKHIQAAVQACGYEVGISPPTRWFSRNINDYVDVGIAAILVFVLYYILQNTGILNLNVSAGGQLSYVVILLIGVTAGFSTCMAVVGGLVLAISARWSELHPELSGWKKFQPHVFFNLGRILGFLLLGGLIGAAGSVLNLSHGVVALLTILVGGTMILLGAKLVELFPRLNKLSLTLPSWVSKKFGLHGSGGEDKTAFISGILTFFLPCGFTQSMQLYAISTGNFVAGAMVMGLFALGTTPGLLGIGGLASFMKGTFAKQFFKAAGVVVIMLGIFNIQNGLNLGGFELPFLRSAPANNTGVLAQQEDKKQTIRMIASNSLGYSPAEFTLKQNVPVQWFVDSQDEFSCLNTLVVPKLNITRNLQRGENTIEFIPSIAGDIPFSCSMGMYRGILHVLPS